MLLLIIAFIACVPCALQGQLSNKKISINKQNITFATAIAEFEKKLNTTISYANSLVPKSLVSIKFFNTPANQAFTNFLNQYGLTYREINKQNVVLSTLPKIKKQSNHKVSGWVKDAKSAENFIGATIFNFSNNRTAITNENGYFIIDLQAGKNIIQYHYPGYQTEYDTLSYDRNYIVTKNLQIHSDTIAPIYINSEVRIAGSESGGLVAGSHRLSAEKINFVPQIMGETDVMRTISMLPGVVAGAEGVLGVYVRGGNLDENLVLLDGVPIFNAYHLYGIFSSFNADMVKNTDLLKSYFPAKYGGRLSSIISVNSINGNAYKIKGSVNIGLLATKIQVDGPIFKDRTTFAISARRSYLDFLAQQVSRRISFDDSFNNNFYYFFDAQAKITHKFNTKLKLTLGYYSSIDKGGFKQNTSNQSTKGNIDETSQETTQWGNNVLSGNLSYLYANNTYFKLSVHQTKYNFNFNQIYRFKQDIINSAVDIDDQTEYNLNTGILDREAKLETEKILKWTTINIGTGIINHRFVPGNRYLKSTINQTSTRIDFNDVYSSTFEFYQFAEWAQNFHRRTFLNVGLRNSIHFDDLGLLYAFPEPRLAIKHQVYKQHWVNAALTQNYQFFHLLNNFTVGLPSDIWVPSTENIKPVNSRQASIGYLLDKKQIGLGIEGFYKQYQNLLEYKETASYATNNINWENIVTTGTGKAYGAEFIFEKKIGKLRGWASYTYLVSTRQFNELNNGKSFASRYDRRHNASLTANYKINSKINLSAAFIYATGFAYTLPIGKFNSPTPQDPYREIYIYGDRNDQRATPNMRLDIAASFKKEKKNYTRTWTLGLFNATNKHNPFYYQYLYNKYSDRKLYSVSLLPILPNISFEIKF